LYFFVLEAIKNRYLGAERRKKRIRRQNDRKFIFDWDNTDDTSADYNPIYSDRHYTQVRQFKLYFFKSFFLLVVAKCQIRI
jgi:hypothetical protein